VNNACTNKCRSPDTDFRSSLSVVQTRIIDNICSIIWETIHSTGTDSVLAQPHNDQGISVEDFFDYIQEELIEQPDNSFDCLISSVAATEDRMQVSAVLPIGGSAIASSSQPVPCSNSNSNDITNNTIINSIENTGLVNASTIEDGVMLLAE